MSLTRNQWIEMWSSVKLLESHAFELKKDFYPHLGPYRGRKLQAIAREIVDETTKMKKQIESVIGQME